MLQNNKSGKLKIEEMPNPILTPRDVLVRDDCSLISQLRPLDFFIMIGLVLVMAAYAIVYMKFSAYPAEDAAILMRYAKHLAQGHGIVWNVGDKPVDGVTDFLFLVPLAALAKAGISLEIGTRLIGFASHILTVVIVYVAIRRLHGLSRWMAVISAAYLAIGPGLKYVEAHFGTTLFALAACVTWYLAIKSVREGNSHTTPLVFALSGLVMGLIRPEGVFLALFMLLAILSMNGLKRSRKILLYFLGVFAVVGGMYFLWRWNYFSYPLPNPFYKKGGGHLYWSSLYISIRNAAVLSLPFTWAFVLGLRSTKTAKQTVFSLIPIIGFTAIWVLLSNEMNYFMRFQYPILPLVLMSWPSLLRGIRKDWNLPALSDLYRRNPKTLALLVLIVVSGILTYNHRINRYRSLFQDGRYDVAVMLNEHSRRNYTIATTEAGLLPLYSDWRAIDTWGLNDQWIAHNGGITESYLELTRPHIIMFHAYFSPVVPPSRQGAWSAMITTLKSYAERNGYCLAAAFGETPYDTHHYYVRPDFPESAEVIRRIQNMEYSWYATGRKSINFIVPDRSDG